MPMISEATPIEFDGPLPEEADVVVIGAGVVGVSTAYFLARSGARVAVFEKGRVAGEQSSRNWGWVRQQGRDPAELPIAMEANRIWRGLAEETGERDLAFTECGCLYVATDPARMARWEEWREVAAQHQLDSRILSAKEVEALVPALNGAWAGGIFTPSDGRAEPFVAVPALARAAARLGATIVEGCAVRTVEAEAGRVRAVHTERGRIGAQAVVLAGGAWTSYFASNLGLDLPQLTVRSTAGRTNPGRRPRDAGRVLAAALHPPPRGRGLHGGERGSRRALRRAALVPLPDEVPVPARGERARPSPRHRPAARGSRGAGEAGAAGRRTT